MCRNIKPLFNFEPPATHDEIHDAALQFVRKVSGTARPSKRNEVVFHQAVEAIAASVHDLLHAMDTPQLPKNREEVAARARARSAARFTRPAA